jgi:hypothetical protein
MLVHQYRCIFVHIPKTGGKSVQRFFGTHWQDHKDISGYAQELEPHIFESYHKFAIVRNPWDRVVSDYIYQKKKRSPRSARLCVEDDRGRTRTFREWLEAVLADPFRFAPDQWGARVSRGIHRWSPQLDWISINGKIAVDSVLHMENLQKEFAELSSNLGLPSRQLPCRNWRFHAHYSYYHDDSTRKLVEKYYEKDIETFGYRFNSQGGNFRLVVPQRCGMRLKSLLSQLVQSG